MSGQDIIERESSHFMVQLPMGWKNFYRDTQLECMCIECGRKISDDGSPSKEDISGRPEKMCSGCKKANSNMAETTGSPGKKKTPEWFRHYANTVTKKCNQCHEVFKKKSDLQKHVKSCHVPDSESEDIEAVKERVKAIKEKSKKSRFKRTCEECKEVFDRKCDLSAHKRKKHGRGNGKKVCCICSKGFSTVKRLNMHMDHHNINGRYKCYYCQKKFNKAWKMRIHLVCHTGRAPYTCPYCGEDFLYPGKIMEHLKLHGLWHSCQNCGMGFRTTFDLRYHICRIYGCKDCPQTFASSVELGMHAEAHEKLAEANAALMHNEVQDSLKTEGVESANNLKEENCADLTKIEGNDEDKLELFKREKTPETSVDFAKEDTSCQIVLENTQNNRSAQNNRKLDVEVIDDKSKVSVQTVVNHPVERRIMVKFLYNGIDITQKINTTEIESHINMSVGSDSNILGQGSSSEGPIDTLKEKEEEINQSLTKDKVGARVKFCLNSMSPPTTQHCKNGMQASLESWLTGDIVVNKQQDFVFGQEQNILDTSKARGKARDSSCPFTRRVLKKDKSDMSFEDLCDF